MALFPDKKAPECNVQLWWRCALNI